MTRIPENAALPRHVIRKAWKTNGQYRQRLVLRLNRDGRSREIALPGLDPATDDFRTAYHRELARLHRELEPPSMSVVAESAAPVAPPPEREKSPDASKAFVDLLLTLDDAYDRAAKAYRAGQTDAAIAEKLGLSEQFVAATREKNFGPLAAQDSAREQRKAIEALRAELYQQQKIGAALLEQLDIMRASFDAVRAQAAALSKSATSQRAVLARIERSGA